MANITGFQIGDSSAFPEIASGGGGIPLDPATARGWGQQPPGPQSQAAQNAYQTAFQTGTPTATPGVDTSYVDQARLLQDQAIQALQAQAMGSLDTYSQRALQAQNLAGQQGQYALASAQHGTGAGAQMRQAQRGAQQVQAQLPAQQNILRAQEMQAAQALQAQLRGQMMGQDSQQAAMLAQNQLQGWALQDQNAQWSVSQGVQDMLARAALEQQMQAGILGLGQQDWQANNNLLGQMAGTVGGIAGTAASALGSYGGGGSTLGQLASNPYSYGGVGATTPGMGTYYGQSNPGEWAGWSPSTPWYGNGN